MTGRLELAVTIGVNGDPARLPVHVTDAEAAGADMIWMAEAYGRDAVSLLGFAAACTRRVRLGTGVLNVFSRTPALLAQSAAALDDVSGGRFELGLGASGPQVVEGWHGVPFDRPLQRTREVVLACRQVWRRDRLRQDGPTIQVPLDPARGKALKLSSHPVRADIPVWLAGIGPRTVALAAEIAHGWLPPFFVPERADRVWGGDLRAGAARRDPALPPLRIAAGGHVEITGGSAAAARAARDRARPWLARYVGGMGAPGADYYNDLVRRYGFTADAGRVQQLYLDRKPEAAAAALSEEILEAVTVCGPPSYVQERLAAYRAAGVEQFRVADLGGGPDPRTLEAVAELVR